LNPKLNPKQNLNNLVPDICENPTAGNVEPINILKWHSQKRMPFINFD
jgi:hypothetical protein